MARKKIAAPVEEEEESIDEVIAAAQEKNKPADIDKMPLNSLGDYLRYNKEARLLNKKLKICRYPIKQCPIELHPKERIVFTRSDQPDNPLAVYLSNELIEFKDTLYPGRTYELPRCVVEYLSGKGTPIYERVTNRDGSVDTRLKGFTPRFALRTIYATAN